MTKYIGVTSVYFYEKLSFYCNFSYSLHKANMLKSRVNLSSLYSAKLFSYIDDKNIHLEKLTIVARNMQYT